MARPVFYELAEMSQPGPDGLLGSGAAGPFCAGGRRPVTDMARLLWKLAVSILSGAAQGNGGRPSAVLVGLMQRRDGWHVIMTERAHHLAHHAGQISFPGGKVDTADPDLVATALREADEEGPCRGPVSKFSAGWIRSEARWDLSCSRLWGWSIPT